MKDQAHFKIYDFTTFKKTTAIHILPNILRSESNQTMKFGLLIEYNMKKILLEKYTKSEGQTIPQPFSKKIKIEHISVSIV